MVINFYASLPEDPEEFATDWSSEVFFDSTEEEPIISIADGMDYNDFRFETLAAVLAGVLGMVGHTLMIDGVDYTHDNEEQEEGDPE